METPSTTTPTPTLRLITDLNSSLNHHCSLCHFFHGANEEHCPHARQQRQAVQRSYSQSSDESFYSARTSASTESASSASTIKAKIRQVRRPDSPTLRHKLSPTRTSLRDLRQRQSQQAALMSKSSDERLRAIYEAQILHYLGGPYATLDRIEE